MLPPLALRPPLRPETTRPPHHYHDIIIIITRSVVCARSIYSFSFRFGGSLPSHNPRRPRFPQVYIIIASYSLSSSLSSSSSRHLTSPSSVISCSAVHTLFLISWRLAWLWLAATKSIRKKTARRSRHQHAEPTTTLRRPRLRCAETQSSSSSSSSTSVAVHHPKTPVPPRRRGGLRDASELASERALCARRCRTQNRQLCGCSAEQQQRPAVAAAAAATSSSTTTITIAAANCTTKNHHQF